MKPLQRKHLSLALLLALTGCAGMDTLDNSPKMKAFSEYEFRRSFQAVENEWLTQKWWLAYQDTQLTELINEALAGAPTLEQANARVQLAQAAVQSSNANLYPDISFNAGSNRTNTEHVQGWNSYNLISLNLRWELDFFGKNRQALAAAVSAEKAAQAEAEQARLILTTQIANQYANLVGLHQMRELAEKTVQLRQSSAQLVALKNSQGIETDAAVAQAKSAVSAAQSEVVALDNQINNVRFSIAALLGKGPDRGLAINVARRSQNLTAHQLPRQIQSNLLARRPDIVASRYRAEAASHRVGYAKTLFYPSVNLITFGGFQALNNGNILTSEARAGQFFPSLSLPIFNAGRLNANLKNAKAEYDLAVAQYNDTLSRALQEVASSIATVQAVEKQKNLTHQAEAQANQAHQLILTRYKGGLTTYLEVLNAENGLIQARRATIGLRQQAFNADIALIKALGGGYEFNPTP